MFAPSILFFMNHFALIILLKFKIIVYHRAFKCQIDVQKIQTFSESYFNKVYNLHFYFELTQTKLGEGDYGPVYIANNLKDNQKYAVKIINLPEPFNGHQQMLLMKETINAQKSKHPLIANFYGINYQSLLDPSKLNPTIITEYLPNGSLKSIFNNESQIDLTPTKKCIL